MTESMKFGPEWLRNLSETPVQAQMRFQLAEYRYGKEEMLALFSPSLQPPDFLKSVVPKGVYIEKAQQPLTLTTMTDEETRVWNRGINSDITPMRTVGKGEGRGGLRGVGGRGRARGSGSFYGGRGGGMIGYDDIDPGIRYGERPTRPFERSQSEREQRWSDRNGGEGRGGANNVTGNRNSEGNWRRSRGDDEEWRPSKWSGNNQYRSNSWREEDNWEMPHKGNNLPEWATEKNSEGGGTFDSSGAFRSEMPPEDDDDRKEKVYKKTEKIQPKAEKEEVQKEEKREPEETPPKPPPAAKQQKEQPPEPKKPDLTDHDDTYGQMTDDLAADLVKLIDDEDEEKKSKQWFYRDPQGEIQGPFTCNEMAEWFSSGYFSLNLLVRRACDPHYAPLGDLIANWGFIPFLPENHPLNKEGNLANHQKEQFYQQQRLMMRQRPQKFPEWDMDPSFQQLPPHVVNNNNLRALLAQMQQQQQQQSSTFQMPKPSMPPPRTTEEISRTLNDFLQSLQAKSEQQAVAQAQQSGIESLLNFQQPPPQPGNSTAIQNLLRKMQASHQNKQVNNMETIWNGVNWNQWNNSNPKGIKTEQQVIEEQLRAEEERMREELRKHEEAKRKMDEEEEKKHRNLVREAEELSRRQQEEEDLRRKQEASRRAEVERQRKGEEKRKKDEEKRKLEQEKKERDRLREEERKKKEAEEAKKKATADFMAKVQKSQWCPPAASNTSILDIQRSEREQQQLLRTLQQQQQQQVEQQKPNASMSMQLKWTETQRAQKQPVQSLADIQAEQYEQLLKVEKEKQEREKEKGVVQPTLGSWSQGLTWGTGILPASSVWQGVNSNSAQSGGFWEHIGNPSKPSETPQQPPRPTQPIGPAPAKESKSKAKREEVGVLKLFNNCHYDEFTQWCSTTLHNMQSTVDIPTFVSFLRDIESASEVQEYIQEYLGDEKDAKDFAKQFIERRSRLGNNSISQNHQSPPSKEDFQQVKSKSKKAKKNKMQKVDTRILGFSTTSAPDRINVGDREYPDDI